MLTNALLVSVIPTGQALAQAVDYTQPVPKTQFNFETPEEGWSFAGGAGLDYDRGLEHSGRGNGWVRATSGWNAINNLINVEPNSECSVTAWLRTSDTLTDGYISVRPFNIDGTIGSVINEIKLIGAGSPDPQNRDYNFYTFNFNSGYNNRVLFYVGLFGNGRDSWVQVDDVEVSCVSPVTQPPVPPITQPPVPPVTQPPVPPTDINQAGLDLIKKSEGFIEMAYSDPGGVLTIGFGHTGPDVVEGMIITPEQAEQLLRGDLQEAENTVSSLVTVPLNENEFSALVSFVFNVGAGNFEESVLLQLLNQANYLGAADEFLVWNKDNGEELPGLTERRERERELFLTPPVAPVPPV
jgi:lysozyme